MTGRDIADRNIELDKTTAEIDEKFGDNAAMRASYAMSASIGGTSLAGTNSSRKHGQRRVSNSPFNQAIAVATVVSLMVV